MKPEKVLIVSYYFFPCNLPGAQRTFSWAKYFHESGIYPIVITRNWDHPIKSSMDLFVPVGDAVLHKQEVGYEVYYLPFKGSLRDRFLNRYGENKMIWLRKVLTYLELLTQNFTSLFLAYRNFYAFASELIRKDPSIKVIITSAMPFGLFRICWQLHRKTGIPWIADYRDDWNTTAWTSNYTPLSHITGQKSFPERILSYFEQRSESKWLASASSISSVSKFYADKISRYVRKPSHVIYNGYDIKKENVSIAENSKFTITYVGNLYWKQRIELFLDGAAQAMIKSNANFNINFVGTGYNIQQRERLINYATSKNLSINVTGWMDEIEVQSIIAASHLMLTTSYDDVKGVIPSKVFNYLAFHKLVLLCPSDNGELEETLLKSGLGMIANDEKVCCEKIIRAYESFIAGISFTTPNIAFIESLSRKSQASKMASIIHDTIRK